MAKTIKGDIVTSFLKQEMYADLPRLALARIIYKANPDVFKDVENVRTLIRNYTGQKGLDRRQKYSDGEFVDKPRDQNYANEYKAMMPQSAAIEWEPFHIQKGSHKVLILSDIHAPYHDVKALELAIDYGLKKGADTVLLNGDVMDFHTISRFMTDPRARSLADELECGRQILAMLRCAFPGRAIYYKEGNHDERLQNYLILKAPELLGVMQYTLADLLKFGDNRIEHINDKRVVMVGKLPVLHGHEVFGGASVNPARTLYLRAKSSALQGHNHRTSEHTEKDIHGEMSTTWSTGCLCELNPRFMPINNWNHGFAFVEVESDGNYEVQNKRIYNGKIL
jgi:predicted phosphodiesterase